MGTERKALRYRVWLLDYKPRGSTKCRFTTNDKMQRHHLYSYGFTERHTFEKVHSASAKIFEYSWQVGTPRESFPCQWHDHHSDRLSPSLVKSYYDDTCLNSRPSSSIIQPLGRLSCSIAFERCRLPRRTTSFSRRALPSSCLVPYSSVRPGYNMLLGSLPVTQRLQV